MTSLSPSELLPLREADGPERESKTGYIQRLQIRGSTKNTATGSKRNRKRQRLLGVEEEWEKRLKMRFKKKSEEGFNGERKEVSEEKQEAERKIVE